ncbi:MAG: hypothetical protein NC548_57230 [Lachnospiraceae bacterium]|nr:hypothetical protein [Lachnospiraceae bacterium]
MAFAYPQETSCYLDYLEQNAERAVRDFICEEDIENLRRFLELGFVTEENIDGFINIAINYTQNGGSAEPQKVLTEYKNNNIGC